MSKLPRLRIIQINGERGYRGGERQTGYLVEGLLRRGAEVLLVTQPQSPLHLQAQREDWPHHPLLMRGDSDPLAALALARLFRRFRPHIIHSQTSRSVLLSTVAQTLSTLPSTRVYTRRTDFSIYKKSPFKWNKYKYLLGSHQYLAISEAVRKVMISDGFPSHLIEVIPSSVPGEIDRPDPTYLDREFDSPPGPIIGNVAQLTEHKGHCYLLSAVPTVLQEFPHAQFYIVGQGELRSTLERQATDLGISSHVTFTGQREDVPAFLQWFDLFVMSSREEALGTTVLDSLLAGTPTLVTDAGGLPEIVRNGVEGYVVPRRDPQGLAGGIIRALGELERGREMALEGAKRVRIHYDVDQMVDRHLHLYYRLRRWKLKD